MMIFCVANTLLLNLCELSGHDHYYKTISEELGNFGTVSEESGRMSTEKMGENGILCYL